MHLRQTQRFFPSVLCVLAGSDIATADTAPPNVEVEVRPEARVTTRLVRVGDIARVTGGDDRTRETIETLDLAERPSSDEVEAITRGQIELRLRLAGLSSHDFRLRGAKTVHIRGGSRRLEDVWLVESARGQLAQHLGIDRDDLSVRLAQPLVIPADDRLNRDGPLELDAIIPERLRLGTVRMRIRLLIDRALVHVLPVTFDVRLLAAVPIASKGISTGEVITQDQVQLDQRAVTDSHILELKDVVGRKARTSIRPGQVIGRNDLVDAGSPAYAVKPRDMVRMVARKGSLTVIVASGEVLQRGRPGDSVRVRNAHSGKTVMAKVKSSAEVEVVF